MMTITCKIAEMKATVLCVACACISSVFRTARYVFLQSVRLEQEIVCERMRGARNVLNPIPETCRIIRSVAAL
jgi:hypothetical protein